MIQKIISTTFTRVFMAILSLLIVVLNSRQLGPEGVAVISIFILDITVINLIGGFFGGSALVYFASKNPLKKIIILSIVGALLTPLILSVLPWIFEYFQWNIESIMPMDYYYDLLIIGALWIFLTNSMNIFLGNQKIYWHNILSVTQSSVLVISLLVYYYFLKEIEVYSFVKAYYISISVPTFLSIVLLFRLKKQERNKSIVQSNSWPEILAYGFKVQWASLLQLFNYRIPYYFLNSKSIQAGQLGIYAVGNQISEGLWIVAKSVSMVQYSRISNEDNMESNAFLTLSLLKFTSIITALGLLVVLLIPTDVYVSILKFESFSEVKNVILYLSPGILAMSMNMIFSHFLSGVGKPGYNLWISAIGLLIIALTSYFWIPAYGIIGAALGASTTYFITMLLSAICFFRVSGASLRALLIAREDFVLAKNIFKEILPTKKI